MSIDEQRREAYQRFLPATSRKDTHKRKLSRWLWGVLLLGFTALAVGGGIILSLPFPLQPDASTLYSTDWSKDINAWNGPGWHTRLLGGVHSDHGGFFYSPYIADDTPIQVDVQLKDLGVDEFVNGGASFGVVIGAYQLTFGDTSLSDLHAPQLQESFALVSIKIRQNMVTLLIDGQQLAQQNTGAPLKGTIGLFAQYNSVIEARSFRVDRLP